MWVLLCAASPALRMAPPFMQLRQVGSLSVGSAGSGRAVPGMAVEQVAAIAPLKAATPVAPVAPVSSAVTALSGNAMEDMWEKSRGRPLRRSLALWLFSMKATWKIVRAHKQEARQVVVSQSVSHHHTPITEHMVHVYTRRS